MMRMLAALTGAAVLLAACSTVPDTSSPQIVQPVGVQPPVQTVSGPPRDASPHDIVDGFLEAGSSGDVAHHQAAREYLTAEQKAHWSDAQVTVVDHTQVRNIRMTKGKQGLAGTIKVSGTQVGVVDETGTFTPSLRGNGSGEGGVAYNQTYGLLKVHGQWRIDTLPSGLLVSAAQFQSFRQYAIYFYDSNEQDLVPAARYTQLTDPTDLVPWLVQEFAGQPPGGLSTGLPQNGSNSVKVTYPADPSDPTQPIKIEVPGSSGLDRNGINRLATQLAATLQQVPQVDRLEITDGGKPVSVPSFGSVFPVDAVSGRYQPEQPSRQLFYVRKGAVYQETGRRIPGRAGLGVYGLNSVALTTNPTSDALEVAGVRGSGDDATLDIPNPKVPGALVATAVHGQLSRPSWAPGRMEVWIGDGTQLKRVTGSGRKDVQTVALNVSSGKASGQVAAVRISPDGGRVALVLTTESSSQIYIGNIVRNNNQVSVNGLTPISPQGVAVSDVAWNDQLKLFATGRDLLVGGEGQVYEVLCDGSIWNSRGNFELPGTPETVTAASGSEAVVSVGDTLWQQQGSTWQGLLNGENQGTNPVYLE
jgi:hypothetical protein